MLRYAIIISGWALLGLYLFYEYQEYGPALINHLTILDPSKVIFHLAIFLAPIGATFTGHLLHKRDVAEENIRAERDRAQRYLDIAGAIIVALGADRRVKLINRKGCEVLGYDSPDSIDRHCGVLGMDWFENFIPERIRADMISIFDRMMAGDAETGEYQENLVLASDGTEKIIAWHNTLLRDGGGNITGTLSSGEDVTERNKIEEEKNAAHKRLVEEKAKTEAVLSSIGDSLSIQDTSFKILYQNRIHKEMMGDCVGRYCYEAYQNKPGMCEGCPVEMTFRDGEIHRTQRSMVKNGETKHMDITVSPLYDSNGEIIAGIEVFKDVTERVEAEEKLKFTQFSVDRAADSILWIDSDARFHNVNDAACRSLGYSREELLSMSVPDIDLNFPADIWPDHWRKIKQDGRAVLESIYKRKDGTTFPVEVYANYLKFGGNEYHCAFVRDITEREAAEESIRLQLQRMTALRHIDAAISGSLDLRVALEVLLSQVLTQLGVDAASILLLNPHARMLEHAASQGFRTDVMKGCAIPLGKGFAGEAALERKPVIFTDIPESPEAFRRVPVIAKEDFRSYFGVPLIAKGQVKGVLEVFNRAPIEPQIDWIEFMSTLAGQAAIAIDSAKLFEELQRSNIELVTAYDTTIEGWSRALDYRDRKVEGHSRRVMEITLEVAREMGIDDENLTHVKRGALLHDIGKLGVPDHILFKPGKLNEEEWAMMKRHPEIGFELLSPISFLRPAINIPYYHHEKWDGTGYPRGLKGEQIPLEARVFAVVDVWDALGSDSPYRPALSWDKVKEYILSESGKHFDPSVVDVFVRLKLS